MQRFCTNCQKVGYPETRTSGSHLISILLWMLFCFPGLIYTLWRLSTVREVCPHCGAPNMIPLDSPRAEGRTETPAEGWARGLVLASRSESLVAIVGLIVIGAITVGMLIGPCAHRPTTENGSQDDSTHAAP